jgi:hypothetical protein
MQIHSVRIELRKKKKRKEFLGKGGQIKIMPADRVPQIQWLEDETSSKMLYILEVIHSSATKTTMRKPTEQ